MGNLYMEASQINYRGGEKKMSVEEALKNTSGEAAAIAQLQQDVSDLNDVKANKITIAPAFSAEASYDPGDLVYYNGLTYRCVNAHSGEWDADDFAGTTIANELSTLESGLTNLENGAMTLLGKLSLNDSVQLPASYKRLYLRVNISDWFNGSINIINGLRPIIPFSVGAWACTLQLDVANGEILFVSETTVTGTKDSRWTTYVEIYYS